MISCNDFKNETIYNFVGDSLIARWPLDEDFPSQLVYNHGKSGEGIDYLNQFGSTLYGSDVVVIIGTNDLKKISEGDIDSYVGVYLDKVSILTNQTIYLYSVLPRDASHDPNDINAKIETFNHQVQTCLKNYPKIKYLDVYEDFLLDGKINNQYYSDGLHLTTYGYEVLTQKLLSKITRN